MRAIPELNHRRSFLSSCLLFGLVASSGAFAAMDAAAQTPAIQFPAVTSVLPQFAFGGGWYSALYFTNVTASAISFSVTFIDDHGQPLTVPSVGGTTAQVNLAAYGTSIIEAPNAGSLIQGYAAFTLPSGVFGYGVFRASATGQPDQEAVVPFSDAGAVSSTLTWDETSFTTSVAIVNPSSTAANVAMTVWDQNGNTIGTSSIALPPYNKTATELRTLPGLAGMLGKRGSAQFKVTTGNVAVLGLRFGQSFTSIPTTANTSNSNSRSSVLPQIAFGGGWYSALYFTNSTGSAVSFSVNFIDGSGKPLVLPSVGGSTAQVNLAANGTAIIEALNNGALVQGYAAFTLPSGVYGYGVFRASVAGQPDQEAVVPLSDAWAVSNTLTWDETSFTTSVAVVNPSSTAANVAMTVWDENGNTIGTSSIALPPYNKTATELRTLPGLAGMLGKRGSAQFKVTTGNVAVLGLRFGQSFTSIPTTSLEAPTVSLVAQRALAQTGLAIGQASTVLQSQLSIALALTERQAGCTALTGGGSVRTGGGNTSVTVYYDNNCQRPYVATAPGLTMTESGGQLVINETATYYSLSGTIIGTMTINETAQIATNTTSVYGLGLFTPATGARTPVQLGVYCALTQFSGSCAGGIAQDFPALGMAIGGVTPLTLSYNGDSATSPVTFTGSGSAVTGPLGSLKLTNPSPTSLILQGGSAFASTTCSGSAAEFVLFPPTPTEWTLMDSAHDQSFAISVVDNTVRNLTLTITQISTGATLATGTVDQSGSGTIKYSDGTTVAITSWTLAD
jgi:P pilus assembly chaperone PapD